MELDAATDELKQAMGANADLWRGVHADGKDDGRMREDHTHKANYRAVAPSRPAAARAMAPARCALMRASAAASPPAGKRDTVAPPAVRPTSAS